MAYIRQTGSDRWQVTIDLKGNRKKHTIRGTKKIAENWARVVETEILTNGTLRQEAKGTVKELIDSYEREMAAAGKIWSDTKTYNLLKIKEQIGHKALKAFSKQDAIAYGKLLAKTRGPNGVKERLNYLSKALKWGKKHKDYPLATQIEGVADAISVLGDLGLVGEGRERTRWLTEEEIDKVKMRWQSHRQASSVDLDAVIDVLRMLPLRIGELCAIEWKHLNPRDRSVKIRRKHPTIRDNWMIVALPTIAGIDTYKLIAGRPRELIRPFPYRPQIISNYFWLTSRMAGVEDFHLHDLRAHAITWLATNGMEKANIKALSGHTRDSKILDRVYTRVSPAQVHDAIERQGLDTKAKPQTGQVVSLTYEDIFQ